MKLLKKTLAIALISKLVIISGVIAMADMSTYCCSHWSKNTIFKDYRLASPAGDSSTTPMTSLGEILIINPYIVTPIPNAPFEKIK